MQTFFSALRDNLAFLCVCLLTFAALFLLAYLAERAMKVPRIQGAKYISYLAMFAALSGVLMFFELPLFFAPPFYKLDFSEIPVLISTFLLGPVAGVVTEFLKIVIKLLLKSTSTAFVGEYANFVVGCSMILPASLLYHIKRSRKSALLGMAVGTLILTVFGSLFNAVYLLPRFASLYGMPLEAIVGMGTEINHSIRSVSTLVLFAVVPFNLLKGVSVSFVTFLLYRRVERLLRLS